MPGPPAQELAEDGERRGQHLKGIMHRSVEVGRACTLACRADIWHPENTQLARRP